MNKFLVIALVVFMVGCGTSSKQPISIQTKRVVVMPSESLFRCPDLPMVPDDVDSMTDVDVADYLLRLYESGKICKESLEDVRQFLIEAKKITEDQNKAD